MPTTCATADAPELRTSSRERILDAATQLFAANGYENTSTLSIARAAGTSETQVMKKFVNKQGLLEAVFGEVLGKMEELLNEVQHCSSTRDSLREFFRRAIPWLNDNPAFGKALLLDMRRIRSKNGGEVLSVPGAMPFLQQLDDMLDQAREAGQLKCTMRSPVIRSALFGAIGELLRDPLVRQESSSSSATPDEITEMLDYLLSCFFV
ncbi:MAG TPA: TetR/AcrR family transcriptional regulator [Terriglobales bacterium]|nr:TetR/AcrR family transcriptional regulator [Terriglobales bacterium]